MASTDNDNNNVGPSFIKPGKEYVHTPTEYVKFCLLHPLVGHIISVLLEVRVRIRSRICSLYDISNCS